MISRQIIFPFNKNEKIIIELPEKLDQLFFCDDILINFSSYQETVSLTKDCLLSSLRDFKNKLELSLHGNLLLHNSITEDIGYIWNKVLRGETENIVFNTKNIWVGKKHKIWESPSNMRPKLAKWIYNDANGKIIFHITPELVNITSISKKKYIEWIQTYQPFFKSVISQNIAQAWLDTTQKALEVMEKNLQINNE